MTDPDCAIRDAGNFMVISWLVNSRETEISWGFMFFLAIKEILDVVNVAFFRYGQQLNVV